MKKLLITTAAAALLAGAGFASAQGLKEKSEGAAPAPAAQQSAPAEKIAPAQKAEDKKPGANIKAQAAPGKMEPNADKGKAAQNPAMDKAQSAQTPSSPPAAKNAEGKTELKASESKPAAQPNVAQAPATKPAISGQGSAATSGSANLTPEQRSKIATVIKQQKVAPAKDVNFSISIGTRVPQTVRHYPLPAQVWDAPSHSWRGYDYIVVGDQILVVDPRTFEIVAVLDA